MMGPNSHQEGENLTNRSTNSGQRGLMRFSWQLVPAP
jgi:hypothetical protein